MRISHVLPNKFHSTKLHVRQVHLAKKSERAGRRHCFLLCSFLTHEICSIMAVLCSSVNGATAIPISSLRGERFTFDWLISGFKRQMRISHVLPNKFHSTKLHVRQVHLAKKVKEREGVNIVTLFYTDKKSRTSHPIKCFWLKPLIPEHHRSAEANVVSSSQYFANFVSLASSST